VAGFAPLTVSFQPQANVPGTIQQVLYDFDGDDITELTQTGLQPISHTYATAGEYFPMVTMVTTVGQFSSLGGWNAYSFGPNARLRVNVQQLPIVFRTINIVDPVDLKATADGNLYVLSRSAA